jgi:hypothetical protein
MSDKPTVAIKKWIQGVDALSHYLGRFEHTFFNHVYDCSKTVDPVFSSPAEDISKSITKILN